jgi:hypothetical protein
MAITNKAMLVAVHISSWSARKYDKKASSEVANSNSAAESAGRYNKRLFANAEALEAVQRITGRIRTYFYKVTLPWSDEGLRILPASLYEDFTTEMRKFDTEFNEAVQNFIEQYHELVSQARYSLGGLYRAEDYPEPVKVREKFNLKPEFLPIPTGDDFRVELNEDEMRRIAREIDASTRATMQAGIRDLWMRMYDVISHMAKRLADPEARFHTTLVTNVRDLVDILPKLNLSGDAYLNDLAAKAQDLLCKHSPDMLRNSPSARNTTAIHASQLARSIADVLDRSQTQGETSAEGDTQAAAVVVEAKSDEIFEHMAELMGAA